MEIATTAAQQSAEANSVSFNGDPEPPAWVMDLYLDVDLAVESLTHPERYPLVSEAQPNRRAQATKARRRTGAKRSSRRRLRG